MAEVIVALDLPAAADALRLVDRVPGLRWAKLGPMLFLEGGPGLVGELKARGIKIFLDFKWHDIPNTVAGAVRAASRLGIDLATVHVLGGEEMLRAAADARNGMRLAGVSVLTSHTPESYGKAVGAERLDLGAEVARLTRVAVQAGLDAIVTSPLEVAAVRAIAGPGRWIVVPGIRTSGVAAGDQQRTADPAQAAAAGATHLVVGRPILEAVEPAAVYHEICDAVA